MRAQDHEDEEEDASQADEAANLLPLPAAESGLYSSSGGGMRLSNRKRTGLLWSAGAGAGEPAFSACSSGAGGAAGAAPTAPRLCQLSGFVLDLTMLVRVFFVRGLFMEQRWLFPMLLAGSAVGYEVAASTILNVIGQFYLAISSMDTPLFLQVLWRSLLVVTLIAILKAGRDLSKEACALVWRHGLVNFLHLWYLRGKMPYVLSTAEAGRDKRGGGGAYINSGGAAARDRSCGSGGGFDGDGTAAILDNPDQRVTADAAALTTALADVVHATLVVPFLVAFYTWYLVGMFGWIAPLACYLYFVVASTANWAIVKKVVPAVYKQQKAEGTFRYDHAWLRTHSESVVFCGVEAVEGRERDRLGASFDAVVHASWSMIKRHIPLYTLTHFFDYLGSIINYAAVGGAILYLSKAEGMGEAEIAALVARGSYSCLYLIDAFSQALRASEAATRVGGSAGRVAELLRATGFSDGDARKFGPWSTKPQRPPSGRNPRNSKAGGGGGGGVGGGGAGGTAGGSSPPDSGVRTPVVSFFERLGREVRDWWRRGVTEGRRASPPRSLQGSGWRGSRGLGGWGNGEDEGVGGGGTIVGTGGVLSRDLERGEEGGCGGGGVSSLTPLIQTRLSWGRGLAALDAGAAGARGGGAGRGRGGVAEEECSWEHHHSRGYVPPVTTSGSGVGAAGDGGSAGDDMIGGGGGGGVGDRKTGRSGDLVADGDRRSSEAGAAGAAADTGRVGSGASAATEEGAFVGAFVGGDSNGPDLVASELAPAAAVGPTTARGGETSDDWLLKIDDYTVAQPEQHIRLSDDGDDFLSSDGGSSDGFDTDEDDEEVPAAWYPHAGGLTVVATCGASSSTGGGGGGGGGSRYGWGTSAATAARNRAEEGGAIVRELRLTVKRGHNLLITGPSGCGKTSLLRSIAGLWEAAAGTVELCPRVEACRLAHETRGITGRRSSITGDCEVGGGVIFVPQRPYCFRGTLFEQVTYPASAEHASVRTVNGILCDLGLSHLISLGSGGGGDPRHSSGVASRGRVYGADARGRYSSRFPGSAYGEGDGACEAASDFRRHGTEGGGIGGIGAGGISSRNSEDAYDEEISTSPLMSVAAAAAAAAAAAGTAGTRTNTSCYSSSSSVAGLPRPRDGAGRDPSSSRRRRGSVTPNSSTNLAGGDSVASAAYANSASSVAAADDEQPAAWLRGAREVGLWWNQLLQQQQQQYPPPYPPTDDDEEEQEPDARRSGRRRRRGNAHKKRAERVIAGEERTRRRRGGTTRPQPPKRQRDWATVLSVGEQQRLGIARVLYHRPALAFLDEAMSAITEEAERDAYGLMRDAGVTVVAVGHRASLRALHERVLALGGAPGGGWELSGISSGTEVSGSEIPCSGNGDDAMSMA